MKASQPQRITVFAWLLWRELWSDRAGWASCVYTLDPSLCNWKILENPWNRLRILEVNRNSRFWSYRYKVEYQYP
jgi:hypothetical protein